jgi:cytochrome c peroxidase
MIVVRRPFWIGDRFVGIALMVLIGFIVGPSLTLAAPHAPHGMVTVDGLTVPEIGPLPTQVPTPPTNLSYDEKVELGKQLLS